MTTKLINSLLLALILLAQGIAGKGGIGGKGGVGGSPTGVLTSCTPSTTGLVQTPTPPGLGGGSLSQAFVSPNTAGNTIVIAYSVHTAGSNPTVSDSNGNSYTNYALASSGSVNFTGFYVATGIAAGSNTVTISTLGSSGVYILTEWTGLPTVEASTAAGPVVTSPAPIGPIATTGTNSMILLLGGTLSNSGLPTNSGSWTSVNSGGGTGGLNQGVVLWSCQANLPSAYSNTVSGTGFIFPSMIGLKT